MQEEAAEAEEEEELTDDEVADVAAASGLDDSERLGGVREPASAGDAGSDVDARPEVPPITTPSVMEGISGPSLLTSLSRLTSCPLLAPTLHKYCL